MDHGNFARIEIGKISQNLELFEAIRCSSSSQVNEIPVFDCWISPTNAFDAISRRKRLSIINHLHVSGEIEVIGRAAPPQLNERALMQIQEAQGSIPFLKTKGKPAELEERKLGKSEDTFLFDSTPFV